MKFSTWQLFAIIPIFFAAIILASIYAPGVVATIVAMTTTLIGVLFVQHSAEA